MENDFVNAVARFTVGVSLALALVLIVVGAVIFLLSEAVLSALMHVLGAIFVILGIAILGGVLYGLFRQEQ